MSNFLFSFILAVLPLFGSASSGGFLQHEPAQALSPEQKSAVLAAIEEALGEKQRQTTEVRLGPIEALLAPTLNALPKNGNGKFGHKAARYALHRFFVQRHAWFVKGIDLNGDATPTEMLQNGVPDEVQTLFESRLGAQGLDAHEVAVMAATLENLAHTESMERLGWAYKLKGWKPGVSNMSGLLVDDLLDVYMASYVTGIDLSKMATGKRGVTRLLALADAYYPGFEDVRSFVRRVRNESTASLRSTLSSVDVSHVVTRIGDRYGRWQHYECEDLKTKLFAIEDDGTGRVSLSKFYNAALNHGHWQFTESIDYLRSLGALDESNPANPRVIVTNYLLSPSNCVASSSYYSVCCLDDCEDLVDNLEREIKAPAATPTRIVELVSAMPSPRTLANHTIPAHLLTRLGEIAAANEGMVPLHGRMFAQWMHHVYPRECPYPHLSGTTNPLRTDAFENQTGSKVSASKDEMQQCIADAPGIEGDVGIAWSHEDELYVEQAPPSERPSAWAIARFTVFFITALSTAFFVFRLGWGSGAEVHGDNFAKGHFV